VTSSPVRALVMVLACVAALSFTGCTTRVVPPPATPEDAALLAQYRIDALWAATGLPQTQRPDPESVTNGDPALAFIRCMAQRGHEGFSASQSADGSAFASYQPLTASMPNAERRDWFYCYSRYFSGVGAQTSLLSVEQLDYAYDYFRLTLVPCLASHGHVVVDLPSRQTYIGGMPGTPWFGLGTDDGHWNPYVGVQGFTSPTALPELRSECPPLPGDAYWLDVTAFG
jgi:hypothetical protein